MTRNISDEELEAYWQGRRDGYVLGCLDGTSKMTNQDIVNAGMRAKEIRKDDNYYGHG